MKNLIALFLLILICCQDGPPARYNEDFIEFDRKKELPFSKLIDKYKLDKDSKIRYNIPDSLDFYIELGINKKKDTFLYANQYVSSIDRSIIDKKVNSIIHYDKTDKLIRTKDEGINNSDYVYIYLRTSDNILTLYVRTRFVPATKGNNMQYKEIDYLRYIKMD